MNNERRICVLAGVIPPQYSGAGKRGLRHATILLEKGILWGLITHTHSLEQSLLTNEYIHRFRSHKKKQNRLIILFTSVLFSIKSFVLLYKNRKNIDLIHDFGGLISYLGVICFSKLFKVPLFKEFTLMPDFKKESSHWSQKFRRKFELNNADYIVCISKRLQIWCIDNNIKTPTVVIGNDTSFQPAKVGKTELREHYLSSIYATKSPVLLFLGPKSVRKGFDIVMDCFDLILEKYPNALLLLLGESQKEVNINNKKYNISEYITNKQILDLGVQENPEPYYQLADITLFPSRREGFGNVIIESMAVGTPVIASKIEGITDCIIDNGIDGFLLEGDDPEGYVEAVDELIINKELYSSVSKSAIRKIQEKFSQNIIMSQYLELYKEITTR